MDSERKLTVQEYRALADRATALSAGITQSELIVDEQIHKALAMCSHWLHFKRSEVSKGKNKLISNMTSLEQICFKSECLSAKEFLEVPRLIRRIRDLLILHYDMIHILTANMPKDFQYCAPYDYAHLAARLNAVGTFLRLHPTRLFSIMSRSGQQMSDILFNETICVSASHANSASELEMRQSSRTWSIHDPRISESKSDTICHRASVKYLLLVSQIWMCVAQESSNAVHRQLAWKRIVEFSSKNIEIPAFARAMTPVLMPESLRPGLHAFLMNDGIQALVFAWAVNYEPDRENPHATILEQFNRDVWSHQSKESILWIMNILITKLETYSSPDVPNAGDLSREPERFTSSPLFQHILFTIYSIWGLEPFQYAAPRARVSVLFQALARRIGRHPERYRDRERFGQLLFKCTRLDTGTLFRYMWMSLDYIARTGFLEDCSCANARCPYKQRFQERLASEEALNDDEEGELDEWGMKMKICAGCRMVMYCSKSCQREGWPWHKTYCLKGREYHLVHEPEVEKLSL